MVLDLTRRSVAIFSSEEFEAVHRETTDWDWPSLRQLFVFTEAA
jgi:hypothetical protein